MMFFTRGSSWTPRCTACATIFQPMLTLTFSTPGAALAAAMRAFLSGATWLRAG